MREYVNEAPASFRAAKQEPFFDTLYLPDDFEEPELQQFISIAKGTGGCKGRFPALVDFWLHALLSFLESQMQDQRFEEQAREALCEVVRESTMHKQVRESLGKLKSSFSVSFDYAGALVDAYRMFNDKKLISFALETTQNYYAFFWECETGAFSVE